MMRLQRLSSILVGIVCLGLQPSVASATATYCAVAKQTRDGFVMLRSGPGAHFDPLHTIAPSDLLTVGTERCRSDFGSLLCSEAGDWVFIEAVTKLNTRNVTAKGWANAKLIRQIACEND